MTKNKLKYIASLLLFGLNGIIAMNIQASTEIIVLARTFLGTGTLFLVYCFAPKKKGQKNTRDMIWLVLSGAALGSSWLFLYQAFEYLGVGTATLIYYIAPVIVMILAPILYKEVLSLNSLVGFIIVLIGMYALTSHGVDTGFNLTILLPGICSAFLLALMQLLSKKASTIEGTGRALLQVSGSMFPVVIKIVLNPIGPINLSTGNLILLIILGLINTGLGCYLYFTAINQLPLITVSVLGYLEPLSAVVFGIVLLHESITTGKIIGTVLILCGAVICNINLTEIKSITQRHISLKET